MRLPSRLRALILLAIVLELPVLARLVRLLTGEPRVEEIVVDGVPVEVVKPARGGPWPAWLFVNGAHPGRRTEPVVQRLSRGLARAGYLVLVPDVPGLGEGTITARTLEGTVAVTAAAIASRRRRRRAGRPDRRLDRRRAGAADRRPAGARRPRLRRRGGRAVRRSRADDLPRDDTQLRGGRTAWTVYDVTDLQRRVVARSLVATIADEDERERLLCDARSRRAGGARRGRGAAGARRAHAADAGGPPAAAERRRGAVRRALSRRCPSSCATCSGELSPLGGSLASPRAGRGRRAAERRLLPAGRGARARGGAAERAPDDHRNARPHPAAALARPARGTSGPSTASSCAASGRRPDGDAGRPRRDVGRDAARRRRRPAPGRAQPRDDRVVPPALLAPLRRPRRRVRSSSRCAHPRGCRRCRSGT